MSGVNDKRGCLFLLEDDETLLEEVTDLAEEFGWEVMSACCVEQAVEIFRASASRIQLALVDMMVPQTELDFKQLKQELKNRQKARRLPDLSKSSDSELVRLRQDLVAIDVRIQALVNVKGGLAFLKGIKDCLNGSPIKIAIFSARSPKTEFEDLRKSAIEILTLSHFLQWLQKPVDPDELISLFQAVRAG